MTYKNKQRLIIALVLFLAIVLPGVVACGNVKRVADGVAMTERQEQTALFEWALWEANQRPELALMFAIPNGQVRRGQVMEPGVMAGVPDIFLPVPAGMYHGLFIELKRQGGRVSDKQNMWMARLEKMDYRCVVAYGFEDARSAIEIYLAAEDLA